MVRYTRKYTACSQKPNQPFRFLSGRPAAHVPPPRRESRALIESLDLEADDPAWITRLNEKMLCAQLDYLAGRLQDVGGDLRQLPLYGAPFAVTLDCVSILALTVEDAACIAEIAGASDPSDPYSRRQSISAPAGFPVRPRFGVPEFPESFGDAEAAAAYGRAIRVAREMGAEIVAVQSPAEEPGHLRSKLKGSCERPAASKE